MTDTVQLLTEKIYREGVEKAENRGQELIDEARKKAREIVAEAEKKAQLIIETAEKNAASIKTKTEAEIRLASRQAIGDLKQRINNLIIWQVTQKPISAAMQDVEFIQSLIRKLLEYWLKHFGRADQIKILLPKEDLAKYDDFLENQVNSFLSKGAVVEFDDSLSNGFRIEHDGSGFKISFTDSDFENYFRSHARPATYKFLFGEAE